MATAWNYQENEYITRGSVYCPAITKSEVELYRLSKNKSQNYEVGDEQVAE